jgi:prepilin-type N-terminal cleavage/methylation domain-containing protein
MRKAFALIELLVVISIIALLIGILLPALNMSRQTARKIQNSTQLRGIHQQLVVFSQNNKGWFPGLTNLGKIDEITAGEPFEFAGRYCRDGSIGRLKRENFFTEEYMVSPGEVDPSITGTAELSAEWVQFGSYSVLEYASPFDRAVSAGPSILGQLEWRESLRSTAVVMSDRLLTHDSEVPRSYWTSEPDQWQGSVAYNDGRVEFAMTDKGYNGKYGANVQGVAVIGDLFDGGEFFGPDITGTAVSGGGVGVGSLTSGDPYLSGEFQQ